MPSMQELERTSPAQLAALCQRVAGNPGAYLPEAGAEASKLKLEWNSLQSFPNPNYAVFLVATQLFLPAPTESLITWHFSLATAFFSSFLISPGEPKPPKPQKS